MADDPKATSAQAATEPTDPTAAATPADPNTTPTAEPIAEPAGAAAAATPESAPVDPGPDATPEEQLAFIQEAEDIGLFGDDEPHPDNKIPDPTGKAAEPATPAREGQPPAEPAATPAAAPQGTEPPPASPAAEPAAPGIPTEPATPPQGQARSAVDVLAEMGLLPAGYAQPPAGTQPATPAAGQPPAEQRSAVGTPPTDPAAQSVAQPAAGQPPTGQPAVDPTQGQLAPAQDYAQVRQQQIDILAANQYKLDNATVEALRAEGNEQLIELAPKWSAAIFMDAVTATMHQVAQALPTMMQQFQAQQTQNQKYEEAFHKFWDERGFDLRGHSEDLAALGAAYWSANPNTTPGQVIQNIGAQLILAKQLSPRAGVSAVPAAPTSNGNGQSAAGDPAATPAFSSAAAAPGATPPPAGQVSLMQDFLNSVVAEEEADFG